MDWSEYWWIMRNDAQARADFVRSVAPPFAVVIGIWAYLALRWLYT